MAKSAAFARIKKEILAIVEAIPSGKVSTYKSIGESLDVMPRHVAYILTTLSEVESEQIPWHRVVIPNRNWFAKTLSEEYNIL